MCGKLSATTVGNYWEGILVMALLI
ncbi:hypothetical protein LINGRAHAP2_LOCUS10367 [Linum grandiflorum]